MYCKTKNNPLIVNSYGKCGEITFCLQAGKRVYALNCLYCPQISIDCDLFIQHLENEHDEELSRSMHSTEQHEPLVDAVKIPSSTRNVSLSIENEFDANSCTYEDDDPLLVDHPSRVSLENSAIVADLNTITEQESTDPNGNAEFDANSCTYEDDDPLLVDHPSRVSLENSAIVADLNTITEQESTDPNGNAELHTEENHESFSHSSTSIESYVDDNKYKHSAVNVNDRRQLLEVIIECYKEQPVLWDSKESGKGNNLKHRAYKKITKLINERIGSSYKWLEIKMEIDKIKAKFRKKHKLITNFTQDRNTQTENCDKDVCDDLIMLNSAKPTVSWFFEKLHFLQDHIASDEKDRGKRGSKALANNKTYLPLPKLTLQQNQQFIELYKQHIALWDINHIGYRFKIHREENLKEMLNAVHNEMKIHLKIEDLQKKLYSIRYAVTQEKHRKLECEKLKKEHKPQCMLYTELEFLQDSVGPFKCEYCEEIYNGPDQYRMHKSTHDNTMPYTCQICQRGFMKVGNLTVHLRRHTKDYEFQCVECDKRFATSTDLSVHMRLHTGEKPYFCDVCGQSFRTWTYFDSHKKRHTLNPSHKCSICFKAFYEKTKLNYHIKSHMNVRDQICNICGKTFTCTKYLTQHKQIHTKDKKYSCKICGKRFAQYAGLSGHIKSHGAAIKTSENILLESEYD